MDFPNKKYKIIYVDPPWKYDNINWYKHRGSENKHYSTMEIEEMSKLPVGDICDKDCVLFMWVTTPFLKKGLQLMESWGFKYCTVAFNWVKTYKNGKPYCGMGLYTRNGSEICLLGRTPKTQLKRRDNGIYQVFKSEVRKHSQKPDVVYDFIEKLYGDVPRIELFARTKRRGWDAWGNEVPDYEQGSLANFGDQRRLV